jgi:hypothetical protein
MAGSEKNSKFIWYINYKSRVNKILGAGDGLLILLEQGLHSPGKTCPTLRDFIIMFMTISTKRRHFKSYLWKKSVIKKARKLGG